MRLPPEAPRTNVGSPAGAFEVVATSEVVAADVSMRVVASSVPSGVVVTSSEVAVVVGSSMVVFDSDRAILEVAKIVLVASAVEPEVIVAASEAERLC